MSRRIESVLPGVAACVFLAVLGRPSAALATACTVNPSCGTVAGRFINAKTDCGATGNGSTDDTLCLQAAISQAQTAGSSGTVYVPAGTYLTTSSLNVTASIHILGDGSEKTTLAPVGAIAAVDINTTSPVSLSKFNITWPAVVANQIGVHVRAPSGLNSRSVFRDISITNPDLGFFMDQTQFFVLDHVFVSNFGAAVKIDNSAANADQGDSVITNSTFFCFNTLYSCWAGVQWLGSGGLRFVNNKVGAATYGVQVVLGSGAVTSQLFVDGNSFDNDEIPVSLARGGSTGQLGLVHVSDNTMNGALYGVLVPLDSSGNWLDSLKISGNTLTSSSSSPGSAFGFDVNSTNNIVIAANTLKSSGTGAGTGILVGSSSTHATVTGNTLASFLTALSPAVTTSTVVVQGNGVW